MIIVFGWITVTAFVVGKEPEQTMKCMQTYVAIGPSKTLSQCMCPFNLLSF